MQRRRRLLFLIALALCECARGLVVLDSDYSVETYATYSCPETQYAPSGVTFDSSGNLYLSHWGDYNSYEGSIYRVSPDGTAAKWADGLGTPRRMVWGGGTPYGVYLYVTDVASNSVLKIDPDGSVSPFASVSGAPHALALDRAGAYGGYMYTATRAQDHTYRISANGSVAMFSSFPGTVGGGPVDMVFDPGTDFGGMMYMATDCPSDPELSGLFSFDGSGNAVKFAPVVLSAWNVEIDPFDLFGGELFVSGKIDQAEPYYSIYRVDAAGQVREFAGGPVFAFTFGPDGAMYIPEYLEFERTVIIHRIIPEPATLLLLGLGGLMLRKRRGG